METSGLTSKFVFILHADVVGSTELVQRDELLSHQRIQAAFQNFSEIIFNYGGVTIELRGDALLAQFDKASDAILASLSFQQANINRNEEITDTIRPEVRIGIGMGEVVVADKTVTGESVVLAQRLEQLASPNEIVIQGAVQEVTPSRLPLEFRDLGLQQLKGFNTSIHAFVVSLTPGQSTPPPDVINDQKKSSYKISWPQLIIGLALLLVLTLLLVFWQQAVDEPSYRGSDLATNEMPGKTQTTGLNKDSDHSIAVLPFQNLGNDETQDYFIDGITNDLITDLSQLSGLLVIASNSVFTYKGEQVNIQQVGRDLNVQYVLEGSIQRAGDWVRVNAQLVDARSGHHLWADRFDRQLTNIFALQDDISQQIVSALEVELTPAEARRLRQAYTVDPEAYDLLLRGLELFRRFTKETNSEAREFFMRAVEIDPGFARAHANIALAHAMDLQFGWVSSDPDVINEALKHSELAFSIDPELRQLYFAQCSLYTVLKQHDKAVAAGREAVRLDPSYADGYANLAQALVYAGEPVEALRIMAKAKRLNPRYAFFYTWIEGHAYMLLHEHQMAIAKFREVITKNAFFPGAHLTLTAIYGNLGSISEAEWQAAELLNLQPSFSIEQEKQRVPYKYNKDLDWYIKGLEAAGLPRTKQQLTGSAPALGSANPSIAVLPFVNMSGDDAQEYFSDGFTEDILIELSKISDLTVISRTSTFVFKDRSNNLPLIAKELGVSHVIEGSIRMSSNKLRITAKLVDAKNGVQVWAERYDRKLTEIFALQEELAKEIVNALAVKLSKEETQKLNFSKTDNFEAYDSFLQGLQLSRQRTKSANEMARVAFRNSVRLDPSFARGYGALAILLTHHYRNNWSELSLDEAQARALDLAQKAASLDQSSPQVQWALGFVHLFRREFEQAEIAALKSIALSPNYADGYGLLAFIYNFQGRSEDAVRNTKKAMMLNPYYSYEYPWNLGQGYYLLGRYTEAIEAFIEALDKNESSLYPRLFLAASYIQVNRQDDAEWQIEEIKVQNPDMTLSHFRNTFPLQNPDHMDILISDLRKAGLPE